jgi:hypothetical protein
MIKSALSVLRASSQWFPVCQLLLQMRVVLHRQAQSFMNVMDYGHKDEIFSAIHLAIFSSMSVS